MGRWFVIGTSTAALIPVLALLLLVFWMGFWQNGPGEPIVYISTDADPVTGTPLISRADKLRHRELYRGTTRDDGKSWKWEALTANSTVDNLRPIVPKWQDPRTALVWLRGNYRNNRGEWNTAVVACILPPCP